MRRWRDRLAPQFQTRCRRQTPAWDPVADVASAHQEENSVSERKVIQGPRPGRYLSREWLRTIAQREINDDDTRATIGSHPHDRFDDNIDDEPIIVEDLVAERRRIHDRAKVDSPADGRLRIVQIAVQDDRRHRRPMNAQSHRSALEIGGIIDGQPAREQWVSLYRNGIENRSDRIVNPSVWTRLIQRHVVRSLNGGSHALRHDRSDGIGASEGGCVKLRYSSDLSRWNVRQDGVIGKIRAPRLVDDCAAASGDVVGDLACGSLRECLACTKHQFDLDPDQLVVGRAVDHDAEVFAVRHRDPIRRSPRSDAPQLCEDISPGRIVPWHRSCALPTFPQRYDFAQRVELWDEEIKLRALVEIVGDQFLLAGELQSCDTRDRIGKILYRSRYLEDEETLRRQRIGVGPQL